MKKIKAKLKPYSSLSSDFTKVSNNMFFYIKDVYEYRVYTYLCMKHNTNYNYAFPSYTTIAEECSISLSKAKQCIKSLCEQGYIIKSKYNNGANINNVYYIRYIEIDNDSLEKALTDDIDIELTVINNPITDIEIDI